jgi:uncharacterized protein YpuA (DUF1002 family)
LHRYKKQRTLSLKNELTAHFKTKYERVNNLWQKANKKELSATQRKDLLSVLKARFEKNKHRHKGIEWAKVQARLEAATDKLWSLNEMEQTGGEPDVVGMDKKTG